VRRVLKVLIPCSLAAFLGAEQSAKIQPKHRHSQAGHPPRAFLGYKVQVQNFFAYDCGQEDFGRGLVFHQVLEDRVVNRVGDEHGAGAKKISAV